jgi:hypothetical protein
MENFSGRGGGRCLLDDLLVASLDCEESSRFSYNVIIREPTGAVAPKKSDGASVVIRKKLHLQMSAPLGELHHKKRRARHLHCIDNLIIIIIKLGKLAHTLNLFEEGLEVVLVGY